MVRSKGNERPVAGEAPLTEAYKQAAQREYAENLLHRSNYFMDFFVQLHDGFSPEIYQILEKFQRDLADLFVEALNFNDSEWPTREITGMFIEVLGDDPSVQEWEQVRQKYKEDPEVFEKTFTKTDIYHRFVYNKLCMHGMKIPEENISFEKWLEFLEMVYQKFPRSQPSIP